jgi:hypothetical protein
VGLVSRPYEQGITTLLMKAKGQTIALGVLSESSCRAKEQTNRHGAANDRLHALETPVQPPCFRHGQAPLGQWKFVVRIVSDAFHVEYRSHRPPNAHQ